MNMTRRKARKIALSAVKEAYAGGITELGDAKLVTKAMSSQSIRRRVSESPDADVLLPQLERFLKETRKLRDYWQLNFVVSEGEGSDSTVQLVIASVDCVSGEVELCTGAKVQGQQDYPTRA